MLSDLGLMGSNWCETLVTPPKEACSSVDRMLIIHKIIYVYLNCSFIPLCHVTTTTIPKLRFKFLLSSILDNIARGFYH